MKAIVIIVAAVATLLGVGWYFSNTQVTKPTPVAAVQGPAAKSADQKPDQKPESKAGEKISFETGRDARALGSNHKKEWNDPKFEMPSDENEIVGAYVPRKMIYPKDPSLAKNVKMNDELLILEEHSEDRLSAVR